MSHHEKVILNESLIHPLNRNEVPFHSAIKKQIFIFSSFQGKAGPSPASQVAVVGGGMAGLAAAASLSKAGFDVVLLEAANYLGKFISKCF